MKSWLRKTLDTLACVWRLRPHMRGGRYLALAVVVSSMLVACLEGIGVSMLVPLLSLLKGGEEAARMTPIRWMQDWLPGHSISFYVAAFCLAIVAAIAAKNAALIGSNMLGIRLRKRIAWNLSNSLFQRLHRTNLHLFEQRTSGELSAIFFQETGRVLSLVDYLILFSQRLSMGLFYLAMLFYFSWQLTLLTIILAAGIGGAIALLARRLAQSGERVIELNRKISTLVSESFSGIRILRATNSQNEVMARYGAMTRDYGDIEESVSRSGLSIAPLSEIIAVAGSMLIVGSAYILFVQPGSMTSNQLFVFGFVLLRLMPLVSQIYSIQGRLVFLSPSVREVEKWLLSPQYPAQPFGGAALEKVREAIRFEHVSFEYANGTKALHDVSLTLPAGKTVALVGASGSGKSTIAALLLRFRAVTSGKITVDGRDCWDFSPESWHEATAIVEQEGFLFHDTLRANIAFGLPHATEDAIRDAVRIAYLDGLIQSLPKGLDTVVGERGTMLSGGQRQRLAIARAVVRNPRILILDEATSALDNISEREVQRALEEAMKDRTVLVIAHRLTTIRNADCIVVMDHGRIVQQGTWEELASVPGPFQTLLPQAIKQET